MALNPPGGSPGPLAPQAVKGQDIFIRQGHTEDDYGYLVSPPSPKSNLSDEPKELRGM